jgi:ABC-type transporter Mla subunit MlaD
VDNIGEISGQLRKLADSGDLDRMVRRIADAADRLDGLIGDNQYDVRVMVQDLRTTANNLRVLSENIKRYPAGVLVGGPPEKVQLPARSQ